MTTIETFTNSYLKKIPEFRAGDTVQVYQKVKEGDKERIQIFEGLVLAMKHGKGISGTFSVRKIAQGVGVERTFPLHSPLIEKITIVKQSKVRRAKLYYLREAKGKKAKLKARKLGIAVAEPAKEQPVLASSEEPAKEPEKTE